VYNVPAYFSGLEELPERFHLMICLESISRGLDEFAASLAPDYEILWINPGSNGYSDAVGHHCYERLAEQDGPCEDCPVAESFIDHKLTEAVINLGEGRQVSVKGYPTSSGNGNPGGVILVARTVRQVTESENTVHDGPTLYKIPLDQSSYPHITFDLETLKTVRYNIAAITLFGYSYKEFEEINLGTLDVKSTPDEITSLVDKVKKDGYYCYDTVIANSSGDNFDCQVVLCRMELISQPIIFAVFQNIAERKDAERLLAESESLYRSLVENSPDIILELDHKGSILFCNRVLTGLNKEDAIGTNLLDYIQKEHHKKVRQALDRSVTRRRNTSYEVSVTTPAGTRWWSTRVLPLERNGRLDRFLLIITDNTEARRSVEALTLSEERYRNLVENSPLPIFVYSDETIRYLSPMGVKLIGASGSEKLLGRSILDFVHPDDRETARQSLIQETNTVDKTTQSEFRIKRIDGQILNVVCSAIHVNFEGEPSKLAIIKDVTARVKAEEALRASETKFRYITENMRDAVWMMDFNWQHIYISPSIEKIRGFTTDEIRNLPIEESLPPHSLENAKRLLADVLSTGGYAEDGSPFTVMFEQEEYCKDGTLIWTEVQATLVYDEEGKPVGMMGITRDITERREAEKSLKQSEEQYRNLLENSPLPIIIHREGKVIYANAMAMSTMNAESTDQMVGMETMDFVHESNREELLKMREYLNENIYATNRGKMKLVTFDGNPIESEFTSMHVTFSGAPARMIMFYNFNGDDSSSQY
jgi:PAS domain S-box-containing protein